MYWVADLLSINAVLMHSHLINIPAHLHKAKRLPLQFCGDATMHMISNISNINASASDVLVSDALTRP